MLPFLSTLIGSGIYLIINIVKNISPILKRIIFSIIIVLYLISFLNYLYTYYYQFTTIGGEYWNQSSRVISRFVQNNYFKYKHIYIVTSDEHILIQYAIENRVSPYLFRQIWRNGKDKEYIGKTVFINSCLNNGVGDPFKFLPHNTLYIVNVTTGNCYANSKPGFKITDPMEPLRTIYNIYEKN